MAHVCFALLLCNMLHIFTCTHIKHVCNQQQLIIWITIDKHIIGNQLVHIYNQCHTYVTPCSRNGLLCHTYVIRDNERVKHEIFHIMITKIERN